MQTVVQKYEALEAILNWATPVWHPLPSIRVAALLGVSLQVLANWRVRDGGPPHLGVTRGRGNRVFYRLDELAAWLADDGREPWEIRWEWMQRRGFEMEPVTKESICWFSDQLDEVWAKA